MSGLQTTPGEDETAVRQAINAFAEMWNRHDLEAFAALFMPNAHFVNVTGQWWRGREAIRLNHAFTHGAIANDIGDVTLPQHVYGVFKDSTYSFARVEVAFLSPDIAVAHGAWTLLGDARSSEPRHGIMTFVVVRDAGHWRYASVQNTEINRVVK